MIAKRFIFACSLSIFGMACKPTNNNNMNQTNRPLNMLQDPDQVQVVYPVSDTVNVVDDYFGVKIADPYRWLEGQNPEDSLKVKEWVQNQAQTADNYLKAIPLREPILGRLNEIWNYERVGMPFKKGDNFYFYKNDGLQNQYVLYKVKNLDSLHTAKVFLDPNKLSTDGTIALNQVVFSKDGKTVAYSVSSGGSDWEEIQIMNTETGEKYPEVLKWVKFSGIAWAKNGFYYSRYPETDPATNKYTEKNEYHELYYHQVGTDQSKDVLVFKDNRNPSRLFSPQTSEDERFLFIYASETTNGNSLYFQRLDQPSQGVEILVDNFDHNHSVLDVQGENLLVHTDYQAPNYQILQINLSNPAPKNWKPFIKEDKNRVLESVEACGDKYVLTFTKDACSMLEIYQLSGKFAQRIALPDSIGQVSGVSGDKILGYFFYSFESFTRPNSIVHYNLADGKHKIWKSAKIPSYDSELYTAKQEFFASKDGTKVPMFIIHKKDIVLDGNNPTLLYGYGGFNISLNPHFLLGELPFLENGGVYVIANIRGGGEYGKRWHDAGRLFNKQNCFDDFIAAAEHLIKQKYTSASRLAIEGGSNGGLLVGACMTQRPELFKVAIPRVGVLDMLRYHQFTIGDAWAYDYGLSSDAEQFKNLLKYSPLHNVQPKNYPATLVMTGEYDDRVVPAHSYKFAATLQKAQTSQRPILMRIDRKAGHGAGKPTSKKLEELADKISFTLFNLGLR